MSIPAFPTQNKNRIWEIDALRGLCILLMVTYHTLYDLRYLYHAGFDLSKPLWRILVFFFAGLFIFLSGISTNFSRSSLRRGLLVFSGGLVITLVTYFATPENFVCFGILHLLGVCMILSHGAQRLDLKRHWMTTLLCVLVLFVLGLYLTQERVPFPWLLPLGLMPIGYTAMDYFPLLPWAGVFLLGMLTGRVFYAERTTRFPCKHPPRILMFFGRHTLWIYLLHQPILLVLLSAIFQQPLFG